MNQSLRYGVTYSDIDLLELIRWINKLIYVTVLCFLQRAVERLDFPEHLS